MKQSVFFHVTSFSAGLIFAVGLGVSGMTQPAKVKAFLDVANWNPALMWVMAGAIGVYAIGHLFARRLKKPFFAPNWSHIPKIGSDLPNSVKIGNVLFGAGWGLAGYCPGPALVSLASMNSEVITFTISMFVGFMLYEPYSRK